MFFHLFIHNNFNVSVYILYKIILLYKLMNKPNVFLFNPAVNMATSGYKTRCEIFLFYVYWRPNVTLSLLQLN